MTSSLLPLRIASLPKAELHLHLEGSIQPATVCQLTARHGVVMTEEEVRQRYTYPDSRIYRSLQVGYVFPARTAGLRSHRAQSRRTLLAQNVVYTEVTLSIGVMLLRRQQPEANFEAILRATEPFESRGLRFRWIFDAARHSEPTPQWKSSSPPGAAIQKKS